MSELNFEPGTVVGIYGTAASGKLHVAMDTIGGLHAADPDAIAMVIDTEYRGINDHYVKQFGVDSERMVVFNTNEHAAILRHLEEFGKLVDEGMPLKMLVVYSISAIFYRLFAGPGPSEQNQMLGMLRSFAKGYGVTVLLVCQVRANMVLGSAQSEPYLPSPRGVRDVADCLVGVDKCRITSMEKVEC